MASQLPPAVSIPVGIPLAVHVFVVSANPKPHLTKNVMMYFFDQTQTWWRIQVDATQNRYFQCLIEQMDPAAGNTILTLKQDAENAVYGAFMGVTNVQTSVPTAPWTEHQIDNRYIAFTLSGTSEVLNQYKGKPFGPKVAQDGRTIIAETGVLQEHDRNTCVYGLITVGGNPLLPPLPTLPTLPPLPHLHEIFQYFESLGIPQGIIRWFTRCTDVDMWRRRMQRLVL